ncbi:MAG: hypothetical protein OXC30_01690 [Alphaproteobacteria bacterium]|nr:hypothetical protein [Alphaproteobacteria bacterium]
MTWIHVIKPFYLNLPCCGHHVYDDSFGINHTPPEESNVLVISGSVPVSAWPLIQNIYQNMQKPSALIRLGFGGEHLYGEWVPDLGIVPHVILPGCPVTKDVVTEAFERLMEYR